MRVYIINDTRNFHAGATAATEGIIKTLEAQGHEITGTCKVGKDPNMEGEFPAVGYLDGGPKYHAVVCNGEGTLHHGRGQPLLNFMQSAADRGKKVFLVNATWDSMTTFDAKKLMKAKNVFFREDHAWKTPAEGLVSVFKDLRSGFHGTYIGLIDKFKGFKPDAGPSSDSKTMKIVNKKLNQFCLNRCQHIFRRSKKDREEKRKGHKRNNDKRPWRLRLVVMGHTHYPWLIVAPRRYSTFLQRKRRGLEKLWADR